MTRAHYMYFNKKSYDVSDRLIKGQLASRQIDYFSQLPLLHDHNLKRLHFLYRILSAVMGKKDTCWYQANLAGYSLSSQVKSAAANSRMTGKFPRLMDDWSIIIKGLQEYSTPLIPANVLNLVDGDETAAAGKIIILYEEIFKSKRLNWEHIDKVLLRKLYNKWQHQCISNEKRNKQENKPHECCARRSRITVEKTSKRK
uniref:Uncharacterized protein n=1 Tax=Steinernema glaseri TaxID=37863 RepID=A0A1I7Y9P9_9BILA